MRSVLIGNGKLLVGLAVLMLSGPLMSDSDLLDPTWVKPGVKWEQYQKFMVKPLNIEDVKVLKPAYAADDPDDWVLQTIDIHVIQAIFRDVMEDVLESGKGYPVVYGEADDVLEVEVELLSITPWLKPGSETEVDGHKVTTLGSGELSARVELRDSRSRELLLMIEGDTAVGDEYIEFTAENNLSNLEKIFTQFATRLRKSMDKVHGK